MQAHTDDSVRERLLKVMLDVFQNELDSTAFEQLADHHPELRGLSRERVQAFIDVARGDR